MVIVFVLIIISLMMMMIKEYPTWKAVILNTIICSYVQYIFIQRSQS